MSEKHSMPTNPRFQDLTKEPPFGRLTVIAYAGKDRQGKTLWVCECSCEDRTILTIRAGYLKAGTQSCGCLRKESITVHGGFGTPEYEVWKNMKGRCENKKNKDYGGRGIRVCKRWRESFAAFLEDMGKRPSPIHQLDRRDNDGNYEPGNCRWVTKKKNCRNTRRNRKLTYKGKTRTIADWSERTGLQWTLIRNRLDENWSVVQALETPVGKYKRHKNG